MYDAGNCHYYIDKLARLKNGDFIILVWWLEDNDGNVFADAYVVTFNDQVWDFPLAIDVNTRQDVDTHCSLLPMLLTAMWF